MMQNHFKFCDLVDIDELFIFSASRIRNNTSFLIISKLVSEKLKSKKVETNAF